MGDLTGEAVCCDMVCQDASFGDRSGKRIQAVEAALFVNTPPRAGRDFLRATSADATSL